VVDSFKVEAISFRSIVIAIVSCSSCRRRTRALPCDLLPRKTFGLPVIERGCAEYGRGDKTLRAVAWGTPGDRVFSHATLHGWTEGLGALASGREAKGTATPVPASRILAETKARSPWVDTVVDLFRPVNERRFRSQDRCERLAAVASFLEISTAATGVAAPERMTAWRRLAIAWTGHDLLGFSARIYCTRSEHVAFHRRAESAREEEKDHSRCPPRNKSPPGASNSSPF